MRPRSRDTQAVGPEMIDERALFIPGTAMSPSIRSSSCIVNGPTFGSSVARFRSDSGSPLTSARHK